MRFLISSFFHSPLRLENFLLTAYHSNVYAFVCDVRVCFVRTLPNQQDEIESTMDETANDRTNIICHTIKEAAAQTGGFLFETVLNATNTRNSGKPI